MALGDTDLTLEFGKLAPKADVSVFGRIGDTCVLTTVVFGKETNLGYFPLSVEYVEKLYAGGRIKGSRWVKRDGKPSDDAILNARLIDRSIRPLFPKEFKKEVQIVCTLLSVDGEHSPEILAAITTSAALHVSQIPWNGPISTMRVGYVHENNEDCFVINPAEDVQEYSKLDLVVSSTKNKVLMIETQAEELSEELVAQGIKEAHAVNVQLAEFIDSIRAEIGKKKEEVQPNETLQKVKDYMKSKHMKEIEILLEKQSASDEDYQDTLDQLIEDVSLEQAEFEKKTIAEAIESLSLQKIRDDILDNKKRQDGRALDEVRELRIETNILPRTHGSSIFQRGLTQVMSVTTLGSMSLEQLIEGPEGEETKRYIHHYFSPPYSYGEPGRMGWPGRREIGHGALAEKAIEPVLPSREAFPYTIHVVSEVMSSNGSTSMASTCGSSLSLMDAGVPIKAAVAGISIGLMYKSDDDYILLTDIAGIEDFAGYMDFKVAGTSNGITAIQLDVKNDGLTDAMIPEILERAKTARTFVLEKMNAVVGHPREALSQYAPKVEVLTPPEDKIGEIIGPGGKNIKKIIAQTGAEINISDEGEVSISAVDGQAVDRAVELIQNIYRIVQVGEEFDGTVKRLLPIGAMVEFLPGREGLVHVSKLSDSFVKDPADVVSEGQEVRVKVLEIDDRGRVNLAMANLQGREDGGRPDRRGGGRSDQRGGRRNDRRRDDSRSGYPRDDRRGGGRSQRR